MHKAHFRWIQTINEVTNIDPGVGGASQIMKIEKGGIFEYPESEIPEEFRPYWLFLEKKL